MDWMFICRLDVSLWVGCFSVGWMFLCGLDVSLWVGCVSVGWLYLQHVIFESNDKHFYTAQLPQ